MSDARSDTTDAAALYDQELDDDAWDERDQDAHDNSVRAFLRDKATTNDDDDDGVVGVDTDSDHAAELAISGEVVAELDNGNILTRLSTAGAARASIDSDTGTDQAAINGVNAMEYMVYNRSAGEPTGHLRSYHAPEGDRFKAIEAPQGTGLARDEQIIAREAELQHISDLARKPVMEAGTVNERKMEEVKQRRAQQAIDCREALSRREWPTYSRPGFDRYGPDYLAEQARQDAPKHRVWGPGHVDADEPDLCSRWIDETADRPTPRLPRRVWEPPAAIDPDGTIDELTMNIFEQVAGGVLSDDEPTEVAKQRGVSVRDIRRRVQRVHDKHSDEPLSAELATLMKVPRELFTFGCPNLDEVDPWWPASTVVGTVERVISPESTKIDQVVYIGDVAPNVDRTSVGGETAKLTIWRSSALDAPEMEEGDIIHAKNVKPGQYRQQLTLAATGTSVIDRVARSIRSTPSSDSESQSTSSGTPQNLDAISTGTSQSGTQYSLPRYRRPEHTSVTGELDYNQSAAVHGGPEHRNPIWTRTSWQYSKSWQPDWKLQSDDIVPLARRIAADVSTADDEQPDGDASRAFDPDEFRRALGELNQKLAEPLRPVDIETAEVVLQTQVADDRPIYLRVYTSLVGDWTIAADEACVLVTIENFETCRIAVLDRFTRTDGWLDQLRACLMSSLRLAD